MLGKVNLELFQPLQAILGFHTPNVKLIFEDHELSFTVISSMSVPVFQPYQVISGSSPDPHQSILSVFHRLEPRHVATKLRCGQMASVPSIIPALSLHIKALRACIIELTSVFGT